MSKVSRTVLNRFSDGGHDENHLATCDHPEVPATATCPQGLANSGFRGFDGENIASTSVTSKIDISALNGKAKDLDKTDCMEQ